MNTEHIKYFLEIAKQGSINKASEKLNIHHQHLGRVMTSLENELGTKLLERNKNGVKLTNKGVELIDIMQELNIIVNKIKAISLDDENEALANEFFKIYHFPFTNNEDMNTLMMEIMNMFPKMCLETYEKSNCEIIKIIEQEKYPAMGIVFSFEDFPAFKIKSFNDETLTIISEKKQYWEYGYLQQIQWQVCMMIFL